MKRKILSFVVVLVIILSIAPISSSAAESWVFHADNAMTKKLLNHHSGDVFEISTAAELASLMAFNDSERHFEGVTFNLTQDLDMSAYIWRPICNGALAYNDTRRKYFAGTFNGNGHTISGLRCTEDNDYQGMFGYVYGAVIRDLNIENSSFEGGNYTGSLVGIIEVPTQFTTDNKQTEIRNCTSSSTVTSSGSCVGGLIGAIVGTRVYVHDCVFSGEVNSTSSSGAYAGGIVGCVLSDKEVILGKDSNSGKINGDSAVKGDIIGSLSNNGATMTVADCLSISETAIGISYTSSSGKTTISNCYYKTSSGNYTKDGVEELNLFEAISKVVYAEETHSYDKWSSDGTNHYKECREVTCPDKEGSRKPTFGAHTGGTPDCMSGAICSVCSLAYGEKNPDYHAPNKCLLGWSKSADMHYRRWIGCGKEVIAWEKHSWRNGGCTVCGWSCKHSGGTATCTEKAVCDICSSSYGSVNSSNHTGSEEWVTTPDTHMKKWSCCGLATSEEEAHNMQDGYWCDVCGYVLTPVPFPTPRIGILYTGKEMSAIDEMPGVYVLSGTAKAIKVGHYSVTATLNPGYMWEDGTTSPKTYNWSISKVFIKPDIEITDTSDVYAYTGSAVIPNFVVKDGEKVLDSSEYAVNITDNIELGTGKITVSTKNDSNYDLVTVEKTFTIVKGNPDPETPTSLEGKKGQPLSSVKLPTGWSWKDGSVIMNTVGDNTYIAIYTPTDTEHYNILSDVSLTVSVLNDSIKGTVTSFLSDTDEISIELWKEDSEISDYSTTVVGKDAEYNLSAEPGTYTLKISKKNHVTYETEVTVGPDMAIPDITLNLLGDVNIDKTVNITDAMLVFFHVAKKQFLENEKLGIANVDRNDSVNINDSVKIFYYVAKKITTFDS